MISTEDTIYVKLLDEGIDVWRPVQAQRVDDHVYKISDQSYNREVETWEFEPGTNVRCEWSNKNGENLLIATSECK